MSRTYRRLKGDQTHHLDGLRDQGWMEYKHKGLSYEKAKVLEHAKWHSDSGWVMTTPSWWVRMTETVPQRAEVRQLISKVLRLKDLEETPLFPLAKRPSVYCW